MKDDSTLQLLEKSGLFLVKNLVIDTNAGEATYKLNDVEIDETPYGTFTITISRDMTEQNETRRPKGDAVQMSKTETPFDGWFKAKVMDALFRNTSLDSTDVDTALQPILAAHNQEVRQVLEGLKAYSYPAENLLEGTRALDLKVVDQKFIDSLLERYQKGAPNAEVH